MRARLRSFLNGARFWVVPTAAGLVFLAACNNSPKPSDQQIQEKAAQVTQTAKQDSKEALQDARVAAAKAERKVDDITAGVKEGLHSSAGSDENSRIDLNSASRSDLASLPGISEAKADRIIRGRPYAYPHQLVKRGLLSQGEFDRIAAQVTVK